VQRERYMLLSERSALHNILSSTPLNVKTLAPFGFP
jgi:hypothetical protein